jgi:hypothetical protein
MLLLLLLLLAGESLPSPASQQHALSWHDRVAGVGLQLGGADMVSIKAGEALIHVRMYAAPPEDCLS